MRILVAEDDAVSRHILIAVLRKAGHEVEAAADGAEAWEILQRPEAPRLVILDWMMPEMDGVEVCRRLRDAEGNRPFYVIMLTAKSGKEDIVTALEAGADDYLTKPYDAGELRARVQVGIRIMDMQSALLDRMQELEKALDEVRTLRGILPICANCKKIRDDKGYWNHLEVYLRNHSDAEFSHGICPDCMRILYPEYARDGGKTP